MTRLGLTSQREMEIGGGRFRKRREMHKGRIATVDTYGDEDMGCNMVTHKSNWTWFAYGRPK